MKLMLGGTTVKKMMIHNDTMDATMVASDMQAGVTAYANGQKVTGTGKSFSFASYGDMWTNDSWPIPNNVNTIEISSLDYPVKMSVRVNDMNTLDFSSEQNIGSVFVNGVEYSISVISIDNLLTFLCEKTICLQVFYGKDEYII